MRNVTTGFRGLLFAGALAAATPAMAQNLVANGSFEVDGPGFTLFESWGQFNNVFEDESVEVVAQDGLQSAKMFGQFAPEAQSEAGLFQELSVSPGVKYDLKVYTHVLSSDPIQAQDDTGSPGGNTFGHLALAILDFKNSSGGIIQSNEVQVHDSNTSSLDQWNEYNLSATAPAGAETVQLTLLLLQWDLATGAIFWDNVSLTVGDAEPQPCNPADLAEPFGVLDFSDVIAFLSAFGSGCP